jgi:nitrite reductase/ring-hydroxylating ferredoxin subunit
MSEHGWRAVNDRACFETRLPALLSTNGSPLLPQHLSARPEEARSAVSKDIARAEQSLSRRGLLRIALFASVAAALGEWWGRRVAPAAVPRAAFPIAGSATLAVGQALDFQVPDSPIAALLVRLPDDRFVAFDRRCPHLGCPVVWSAARAELACPCHTARFDARSGAVLSGPPPRGLRRLPIARRDGSVWVLSDNNETEGSEG